MNQGPFEFSIIVNGKEMPEFRDSSGNLYIIVEAGSQYKIAIRNRTPDLIYVEVLIDGKPLYFRYTCITYILIEGYQDRDTLSPFIFSLSPIVRHDSDTDPLALSKVNHTGSITFRVFNSIPGPPQEVNTNQPVPQDHKFTPSSSLKTPQTSTTLGDPQKCILETKVITTNCGNVILFSHTFLVRSPLEMINCGAMGPCWNNWWRKEREAHCLPNMEWKHPDFSSGTTEQILKDFKAKISQPTNLKALNYALKRVGLVAIPGPHRLIEALAITICGNNNMVDNCIMYLYTRISDRLYSTDYSPIYADEENHNVTYPEWRKGNDIPKMALEQPGILLQSFSDTFGIPVHVYYLHGNANKCAVQVVNPLKGKRTWFYGYALAHANGEWYLIQRGDFDLSDDPEDTKQHEQIEKDLAELQKETDRKRKILEDIKERTRRMKTETQP